jgi:hypothetical protein
MGVFVFGDLVHKVGVIVVSGLGKCYNKVAMYLDFIGQR